MINEGFVKFFGGFSFSAGRIMDALGLNDEDTDGLKLEEIKRELD